MVWESHSQLRSIFFIRHFKKKLRLQNLRVSCWLKLTWGFASSLNVGGNTAAAKGGNGVSNWGHRIVICKHPGGNCFFKTLWSLRKDTVTCKTNWLFGSFRTKWPAAIGHGQIKRTTTPISFILWISTDLRFRIGYLYILRFSSSNGFGVTIHQSENENFHIKWTFL